jgi:uncharacterized repeat protein (TIGR03803 family)
MRSSSHLSGLHRAIRIDFFLTVAVCSALLGAPPAQAQTFTVLHAFKGMPDGAGPDGGVILDTFGNVYGTAFSAGVRYRGIAFKVSPEGKESILYNFLAGHGANPDSTLVQDANGVLYGTTQRGGAYNRGVVFKLDRKGKEAVLYSFGGGTDGAWPNAIIRSADGTIYGTTESGGNTGCDNQGCGTAFKLSPAGKKTTLYTFTGKNDGALPVGGLVQDSSGNLYGVTRGGGDVNCNGPYGCGAVFEVDTRGTETVLHSFIGGNDGIWPAGIIRDQEGNFYGTTSQGGPFSNGTVFKLDPTGKETILYSFTGGADGAQPGAAVALDAAGNIYGSTPSGGAGSCYCGVVFVLDTSGKETVLHSFTGGGDGAGPGAVVLDASGNVYGTAGRGGDLSCGYNGEGCGTVFKITP